MARQSQSWKDLERTVANSLGGKRIYRGSDFSESLPDVDHPLFGIECKYRTEPPKLYYKYWDDFTSHYHTTNIVMIHKDRAITTLENLRAYYTDYDNYSSLMAEIPENKKLVKFLEKALIQAAGYNKKKIPMVVLKKKADRKEFIYMKFEDWENLKYVKARQKIQEAP
jgi:hypothetical protein